MMMMKKTNILLIIWMNPLQIISGLMPQKIFGLIRHMRSHHKEHVEQNWIACHQCQLLYPDSKTLQSHTFRSHNSEAREGQESNQRTSPSDMDVTTLVSKETNELNPTMKSKDTKQSSRFYRCKLCSQKCNQYVNYVKHMRSHHPKYVSDPGFCSEFHSGSIGPWALGDDDDDDDDSDDDGDDDDDDYDDGDRIWPMSAEWTEQMSKKWERLEAVTSRTRS